MVYVCAYQFMFQRKMLSKYGVFSLLLYPGVDADAYFTKVTIFRYRLVRKFISFVIFHILK